MDRLQVHAQVLQSYKVLEDTGFTNKTRNVGWIFREEGSFKRIADGPIIFSTSYGPMNLGANF